MDGCSPMSYPLFNARYLTGTVLAHRQSKTTSVIVGLTGFEPVTTKTKLGSSTFELSARFLKAITYLARNTVR